MNEYKYPFNTAYVQANELYGTDATFDDFEPIAMVAWERIGNKQMRLYRLNEVPKESGLGGWYVDLPCNVDRIEAVTTSFEDWESTSNTSVSRNEGNQITEQYSENFKVNQNPLYASGKYIKYTREGNTLYFPGSYSSVNVLYKGFVADEEGLPYLTDKEVDAIAVFFAYTNEFKNARISKDRNSFEMAMYLENKWRKLMLHARTPSYINQNEMDEILNVSTSWDRKRFGRSYKPL